MPRPHEWAGANGAGGAAALNAKDNNGAPNNLQLLTLNSQFIIEKEPPTGLEPVTC
jgi:hypothetical protein